MQLPVVGSGVALKLATPTICPVKIIFCPTLTHASNCSIDNVPVPALLSQKPFRMPEIDGEKINGTVVIDACTRPPPAIPNPETEAVNGVGGAD